MSKMDFKRKGRDGERQRRCTDWDIRLYQGMMTFRSKNWEKKN